MTNTTLAGPMAERSVTDGIPSLREWLGDGARGEGFEAWVRESLAVEQIVATPREAAGIRMIKTLSIAVVEACRRELANGLDYAEVVSLIARAAGVTVMTAILGAVRDDADLTGLADVIAKELEDGAREVVRKAEEMRAHG